MFNIFNKKREVQKTLTERQLQFITIVIQALTDKYPNFKRELDLQTFVWLTPNRIGGQGSFVFGIDDTAWKKNCDTTKENFLIKGIQFKSNNGQKVDIELYTTEGLIVGFSTTEELDNIDIYTININNIWEKYFLNDDYSEIENLLSSVSELELKKLNMVKNTFKITLNQKDYYPIHNIEDGNYFAVDKGGIVYKITHDPLEAKEMYSGVSELLKHLMAQR
jgi:hypothetical protein